MLLSAIPQLRPIHCWRRPLLPALTSCVYGAVGVGVCALTIVLTRAPLSTIEEGFVGRWLTTHGHVETSLELRGDRTVTITQSIRVALAVNTTRVFGPSVTTGRWRFADGHLRLETSSPHLRASPWTSMGVLLRSQRWPAEGALHRDWQIVTLASDRFSFLDAGTDQRGRAIKTRPMVASAGARVTDPAARAWPLHPALRRFSHHASRATSVAAAASLRPRRRSSRLRRTARRAGPTPF